MKAQLDVIVLIAPHVLLRFLAWVTHRAPQPGRERARVWDGDCWRAATSGASQPHGGIAHPHPPTLQIKGQMHPPVLAWKKIYGLNSSTAIGQHPDMQQGMPGNLEAALNPDA